MPDACVHGGKSNCNRSARASSVTVKYHRIRNSPPAPRRAGKVRDNQSKTTPVARKATPIIHPDVKQHTKREGMSPSLVVANTFPEGACTWWANQRYHALHGIFVPWHGNAAEWEGRALAFGWRVSTNAHVGDIIVLQPWIQGASQLGHVGVVEKIYANGRIVASSLHWYPHPERVTTYIFHYGKGVDFIRKA